MPQAKTILCTVLAFTAGTPDPLMSQDLQRSLHESTLRFERLDGLSHNTVFSIEQDHEGFLWVGTSDGLNRYDGYDFVVFRHDPTDSTSLSNNIVKRLFQDRERNLWVGTDDGLDRFDQRTGRFVRYSLDNFGSHRQPVKSVVEDHLGRLWVATSAGIHRYERRADTFKTYSHDSSDPDSAAAGVILGLFLEERTRTLWVKTAGSVQHRYNPDSDRFERFQVPPGWNGLVIHYVERNREPGRLGDDPVRAAGQASENFAWPVDGLADQSIWTVLEDRRGIRWIGTEDGLYRHDPRTGEHRRLLVEPASGAYLQNRVTVLFEDRAGTLWVGTFSGLYRHDPHAKPFHHLAHDPADAGTLSNNTVMAISEDRDGFVWVGTLGGGLNRFDRRTGTVTRYRHHAGDSRSLCHDLIWSLFEDRRGTLWIGTDAGLCALDRRTSRFTGYDLPLVRDWTSRPPVNVIREDPLGRLWVGSNAGLYRLDPQTGEAMSYSRPGDSSGDNSSVFFIQSFHFDRAGFLWIGTFGGGLFRLATDTGDFTHYPLMLTDERELVSEGIWAFHEDPSGTLWLGSDIGLTRFDPQTGNAKHYTQRDGLPGSIVYGILQEDRRGRLWLSTNHGLARFDEGLPPDRRVHVFDTGDGLRNSEFDRRAFFRGSDGTFYFGGLNGLTWFDPASIYDNPVVPPVVLTRIETSNRDTTVLLNPYGLDELVLAHRDYTISFEFVALNFTNPARNRYRYQLDGFDDGWIEAGTGRQARYTNIPPGEYVFRVIGSNNDGRWNEAGVSLRLRVPPPFWQTWWFRLLVASMVVGLLTAAYRYRIAHLLRMERMRMRIASDLHDDIGSKLSGIALMSDLIHDAPWSAHAQQADLPRISRVARQLVDDLRDIVWFITPDHDPPGQMLSKMKSVAATLLGNITCQFHCAEPALLDGADMTFRRNVYLIYKEALHNIARHADARMVEVHLRVHQGTLVMTISDDGVGFDPTKAADGQGLQTMAYRAEQVRGDLDIQSTPGAGTCLTLAAKITRSRYGASVRRGRL